MASGDVGGYRARRPADRTWKIIIALSAASFLWCFVVGLLFWFLPSGGESFASISALGRVPLIIPGGLAAAGAWVGLAYLPAVAALVAASIVSLAATGGASRARAG
jgi:hypothetical protein